MAMLVVLESLSPLERVVFVLREVFGYDHADLAVMLGKTDAAVRQIAHRAREQVQARRPRFRSDPERRQQALERFAAAAITGDVRALAEALAEGAVLFADGGGVAKATLRPISGRDKIARFLIGLLPNYVPPDYRWESRLVNARPGMLIWRGETLDTVMSFEVADGLVSAIHIQRNPEKLSAVAANS